MMGEALPFYLGGRGGLAPLAFFPFCRPCFVPCFPSSFCAILLISKMKTTNFGTRLLVKDAPGLITPLPGQSYIKELIEAVHQAKFSIDVMQYQWNFYPGKSTSLIQQLNRTLIDRVLNGLKVRVLLNKEGRGSHLMAINMRASKYLSDAGASVKFGRSFPITHAKLWLFDDDIVILGSHNLSNRSVTVNNEASVLIKSRPVLMEYRRYFSILWNLL